MAKKPPRPTKTAKQPAKKATAEDAGGATKQELPPALIRQIAHNNSYYKELEFLIWRSINGSKW